MKRSDDLLSILSRRLERISARQDRLAREVSLLREAREWLVTDGTEQMVRAWLAAHGIRVPRMLDSATASPGEEG